jgi:hypothetical protein
MILCLERINTGSYLDHNQVYVYNVTGGSLRCSPITIRYRRQVALAKPLAYTDWIMGPERQRFTSSHSAFRPALESTQRPILPEALSPELKWQRSETDYSLPSSYNVELHFHFSIRLHGLCLRKQSDYFVLQKCLSVLWKNSYNVLRASKSV